MPSSSAPNKQALRHGPHPTDFRCVSTAPTHRLARPASSAISADRNAPPLPRAQRLLPRPGRLAGWFVRGVRGRRLDGQAVLVDIELKRLLAAVSTLPACHLFGRADDSTAKLFSLICAKEMLPALSSPPSPLCRRLDGRRLDDQAILVDVERGTKEMLAVLSTLNSPASYLRAVGGADESTTAHAELRGPTYVAGCRALPATRDLRAQAVPHGRRGNRLSCRLRTGLSVSGTSHCSSRSSPSRERFT